MNLEKEGQFNQLKCANVLNEILAERVRQEAKWGQQNHHGPDYLMILGEEVGEANKEYMEVYFNTKGPQPSDFIVDADYSAYRKELIQIAAVATAMVESLDRNGK